VEVPIGRASPALPTTHAYGAHPDQVGDLHLPPGDAPDRGWPVVVLLHGGFWREEYQRELMIPLADSVASQGWVAWNLEYRRVRGDGGWPATLLDVAAALDHLPVLAAPVDVRRVVVVGHSAGGHLALWLAGRNLLPPDAPGCDPRVIPSAVVGLAPVADLQAADALGLSDRAVTEFLGGGVDEVPERWRAADPLGLVGHGVPTLLVHAVDDDDVPLGLSEAYAAAASSAGDEVELHTPSSGGHMGVIDARSAGWGHALRWLAGRSATTA
jgi:acetyl esterase/lipase